MSILTHIRHILASFLILSVALFVTSCGSSRKVSTIKHSEPEYKVGSSPSTNALLSEARTWLGTRYRYGGNDKSGVDCSGFVLQVYGKALGIKLPRTSVQQHKYCARIDKAQLQPGDLVFFTVRGGSSIGHVGIYMGNSRMIHASSSQGVIVSSLDDTYYRRNYHSSGRVAAFYLMKQKEQIRENLHLAPQTPQPTTSVAQEYESGLEYSSDYFD